MAHIVGVEPLIWNQTMASYVENYANIRVVDCESDHSLELYGDNIFEEWNESSELNACFGRSNFMTMMMELLGFRIWN